MASKNTTTGMNPKVMVFVLLLIAFAAGYLAARMKYKPQIQELTSKTLEKAKEVTEIKTSANKVMMKDGKVWLVKDGVATEELDANIMFSNGDKVMMDGTIVKEDGTSKMMEEGQSMDMNGKLTKE